MTLTTLGYAFLGGLLPSLIWLYFLLKEDASHPEPKRLIVLALVAGMLAVPLAISPEEWIKARLPDPSSYLLGWALIEELLKYGMAAVCIFWRRAVDEAPDYVIYLLTVALGFAAAENALFIGVPLANGDLATSLFTNNARFLGSTLLHAVASATIGFSLAFTARSLPLRRFVAAAFGLILATGLHFAFNSLIMQGGTSTTFTLMAFFLVWSGAVVFLAAFEVLKYLQYRPS